VSSVPVEARLLERLKAGEVVLLNTETLPGLHAIATLETSAPALSDLKGSVEGRPFLLLFDSVEAVLRHGSPADPYDADRLERTWPGPLTALLGPRPSTPPGWVHEGKTFAARVPESPALRALLSELGAPLFSTSANRAGEDPALSLDEARAAFPALPAFDLGIVPLGAASTVVDLSVSPGEILRPGAVAWPPADRVGGRMGGHS
jgi:L-threonylcarbamoyladenylate synthase